MSIREFFSKDFYEHVEPGGRSIGQLFWVPVVFVSEVTRVLEAERRSPEDTAEVLLSVRDATADHFKRRDRLPIPKVSLDETEELVVSKAKKRPCVVLAEAKVSNLDSITDPSHRAKAKHLVKPLF